MGKKNDPPVDLWEIQNGYAAEGYESICGVDEAGRGPLAGPVCAAAVILPPGFEIPGLNDSKQLTDKKRRELFPMIKAEAVAWSIAMVDEQVIDEINILNATFRAMGEAISGLDVHPDLALIDGNRVADFGVKAIPIVKGDARVASIAAASILAKVARDEYMEKMDEIYPEYGFAIHKGYGTKRHYAAVDQYGLCPIHRKTFFKKYFAQQQ